ncbi:cyclic nucleotide-binding domain-containing protein [Thalassolituus sp.]|jgi:CRP-like cAMP-binding protein|uniref:cyclic nucleotide-binding domain-containing protein n=1 Tax=Thalassolituus sp. TaxID=2030822 RepID=UPI0027D64F2A|nr:cyclic nucleotide-binding domain-containing protein [Thalassolituus sp.]MDQ4424881.1 cyclic nucleotide-binding domain-containing protein [Thalassolituus sp.]
MRPVTREEYPLENLHRIVSGVTFFKELLKTDPEQFELLMTQARFVTAEQNEIVLHKGDGANVLYFLLRGELDAIADDNAEEPLGTINPGEPFGVMAMVLNFKRSASIRVSSKNALLAGIEFDHFRHNDNASIFSLTTRITFFRMLNSNIRWALERNKMEAPDHSLVARIRSLPIYSGEKNTAAELHALMELAHLQAELLRDWNDACQASN